MMTAQSSSDIRGAKPALFPSWVQTTAETNPRLRADLTSDRTSELNNLLQIISETSELIYDITKANSQWERT